MKNQSLEWKYLYHITRPEMYRIAEVEGGFREGSLESEGFIHCSFKNQMIQTANRFYSGQAGLLILKIDPQKLGSEVKLESAEDGELFPHIYGPVNLDAILEVLPFNPEPDGRFVSLPAGVD